MSIRDIPEKREKKRRDGSVYRTYNNELGFGPFTWEARQEILMRLLNVQKQMNYELITENELRAIDEIWDNEKDLSRRTLVDLYYGVMGTKLPWDHLKRPMFDDETVAKLQMYAKQYDVPLELLNTMIFSTSKNKYFSNTKRLRDALGKLVTQQWLQEASLCDTEEGIVDGDQEDSDL